MTNQISPLTVNNVPFLPVTATCAYVLMRVCPIVPAQNTVRWEAFVPCHASRDPWTAT